MKNEPSCKRCGFAVQIAYNELMSTGKEEKQFNYGGQAVIEGVMMRGKRALSVAVRNPQGQIVVHTEPLNQAVYNGRLLKTPFLRGLVLLWDALGLGIKSLMWSADIAVQEEDENGEIDNESEAFSTPVKILTVMLSLSMSIGLFFVTPAWISGGVESWMERFVEPNVATYISHVVEGLVRLTFLIGYVSLIGLLDDVRRLYGYHGAEHKTINAYEAQDELTPLTVHEHPIEHPRCGTAFLLTVVLISIILFTLIPLDPLAQWLSPVNDIPVLGRIFTDEPRILARIVSRILLIPAIAGLAYEYIRWTAKHLDNPIVRIITKPNLALQKLTTKEPDEGMLEVAIAAFEVMMAYENGDTSVADEVIVIEDSEAEDAVIEGV